MGSEMCIRDRYRETGGWIITFSTPEESMNAAVTHPLTMIATDSIIENGKGHPRTAGSYTKVLGEFVRSRKDLSLAEALSKMSLMPAKRLEKRAPAFMKKGRIQVGCDADICIFNPNTVIDNSTYTNPTAAPTGMNYVLVNGVPVLSNGRIEEGSFPGTGILA